MDVILYVDRNLAITNGRNSFGPLTTDLDVATLSPELRAELISAPATADGTPILNSKPNSEPYYLAGVPSWRIRSLTTDAAVQDLYNEIEDLHPHLPPNFAVPDLPKAPKVAEATPATAIWVLEENIRRRSAYDSQVLALGPVLKAAKEKCATARRERLLQEAQAEVASPTEKSVILRDVRLKDPAFGDYHAQQYSLRTTGNPVLGLAEFDGQLAASLFTRLKTWIATKNEDLQNDALATLRDTRAQLADWLKRYCTEEQRERAAAGLLPQQDIENAGKAGEMLPFAGFRRFDRLSETDVAHTPDCREYSRRIRFTTGAPASASAKTFALYKDAQRIAEAVEDCDVDLVEHTGHCSGCKATASKTSVRVTIRRGPFTFSRELEPGAKKA